MNKHGLTEVLAALMRRVHIQPWSEQGDPALTGHSFTSPRTGQQVVVRSRKGESASAANTRVRANHGL